MTPWRPFENKHNKVIMVGRTVPEIPAGMVCYLGHKPKPFQPTISSNMENHYFWRHRSLKIKGYFNKVKPLDLSDSLYRADRRFHCSKLPFKTFKITLLLSDQSETEKPEYSKVR